MKRISIALSLLLCAAIAVPAAAEKGKGKTKGGADRWPEVIALPNGFQPEGITTWRKHTFFVGSRATGAIYRGSLRTGEGDILVQGGPVPAQGQAPDDRGATGLKVDKRKRLFVSGADSKFIRVYDARTGDEIRAYSVPDAGFINDVIITRRGAYFTDSQRQHLYVIPFGRRGALGELRTLPITGDFVLTPNAFNLNGIEAARGGKTLIAIKSNTGELFAIDALTGASEKIEVTGGDGELQNGDGLLLQGRRLSVVENRDDSNGTDPGVGVVTTVKLARNLASGEIVRAITDDDFDVPTTIAKARGGTYVVNGRFNTAPTADTAYQVVRVPKR